MSIATFGENISNARDMAATAVALSAQNSTALDLTDMFRMSIVQGVSAFDLLIHTEVRDRIAGIYASPLKDWPAGLTRFRVPLSHVRASPPGRWLEEEIRSQHGHLAFQHPDKVAEACRLVSDVSLWDRVAEDLGIVASGRISGAKKLKQRFKSVVDRRNLIVHEADSDPSALSYAKYPIDAPLTADALDLVEAVGISIVKVL